MTSHSLDTIITTLDTHRQRATYGAVAGLLNRSPRALMIGRPRDPLHSWIVGKDTGMPTGYPDDQLHPELAANPNVIRTRDELGTWLAAVAQ